MVKTKIKSSANLSRSGRPKTKAAPRAVDPPIATANDEADTATIFSSPERLQGLDEFDEFYYTNRYKDIAEAISSGVWHNGLMHFAISGRAGGRVAAPAVDEAWYGSAYPQAAEELTVGKAVSAADHYHRIGRYRGYLAAPQGVRRENPGQTRSRYGGLWTDQGNAMDLIDGRLDLGKLTSPEAALLRRWVMDGYVILRGAVPEKLLAPAAAYLKRAYSGGYPELRFDIDGIGRSVPWAAAALDSPAKALDLHWHSAAVRKAMFAPAIVEFLHLIFERRALASHSLGFWRGLEQNHQQDSAYIGYSMPLQFATSWVALEDVAEGTGEPYVYVDSHRIGEYRYHKRFKGVEEARRLGFSETQTEAKVNQHVERIGRQVQGLGLRTERIPAKRGDVVIWAADLVHGNSAPLETQTCKSLVTHYCPVDCAPSYFERGGARIHRQGTEFYASGSYEEYDSP